MIYKFKCDNKDCRKKFEVAISISDYDKEKNNQKCPYCESHASRVLEWTGTATGYGEGWYGKSNGGNSI